MYIVLLQKDKSNSSNSSDDEIWTIQIMVWRNLGSYDEIWVVLEKADQISSKWRFDQPKFRHVLYIHIYSLKTNPPCVQDGLCKDNPLGYLNVREGALLSPIHGFGALIMNGPDASTIREGQRVWCHFFSLTYVLCLCI